MIKLFKNGDSMGISTDATDERDFLRQLSTLFSDMVENKTYESDWDFQFNYWLPMAVDICCKMRGYKSDVAERRWLFAGNSNPTEEVAAVDDRETVTIHGKIMPID